MPMTLADKAMIEREPLKKGILVGLVKTSFLMEKLPFETIGDLTIQVRRWKSLPDFGWRDINGTFTESTGKLEQLEEAVSVLGGEIDVDVLLAKAKNNVTDPRALQTKMKLKAIAYGFNDAFINGDQAVDPLKVDGLKVRVANLPAEQTYDAGAVDLSTGANRDTNGQDFLDKLDEARYRIDEHKPDLMLMNDKVLLALRSVLRRKGLLDTTKDMFGRDIDSYAGIPLLDVGVKADQSTKVIADNHDGTTGITSIYMVKFGVEEYLHGIEMKDLDVRDLGELETKPAFRTRIEWPWGMAIWNKRAVVRMRNIKIA